MCINPIWKKLAPDPHLLNNVLLLKRFPEQLMYYDVSSDGAILCDGKLLKQYKKRYAQICIFNVLVYVHHLVAYTFIGSRPTDEHEINHKNGDKLDNCYLNLEWTTKSGNTQHAIKLGLCHPNGSGWNYDRRGMNHPQSKLSNIDVYDIKKLYTETRMTYSEIARKYKVSHTCIRSIIKGLRWKHL